MHRRPQVYQFLLLSRVTDVKYGCFTFTFNESVHWKNSQLYNNAYGGPLCFDGGGEGGKF